MKHKLINQSIRMMNRIRNIQTMRKRRTFEGLVRLSVCSTNHHFYKKASLELKNPFQIFTELKSHYTSNLQNSFFSTSITGSENDHSQEERVLMIDLGDGIFNIQLNRPKKCNALDMKMFESIASTISDLQTEYSSRNIRCIILSGNGRAFCTGLDVPSILKPTNSSSGGMSLPHTKMKRLLERPSGYDKRQRDINGEHSSKIGIGNLAQDVGFLWRTLPVPVISVLHGMCFGGGLQIALGADIRIATENCKISIMEAKWGLIPDMSATITLRELISIDVAKELTFTGRIINGSEAKEYGLVTKSISDIKIRQDDTQSSIRSIDERALDEAIALAKEMVKQSPDSIAAAKLMYQKTWVDSNEEQCLDLESRLQKKLIPSWNQFAASTKNFGLKLAYMKQKDFDF